MMAIAAMLLAILAALPMILGSDIVDHRYSAQSEVLAELLGAQYLAAIDLCQASSPPSSCNGMGIDDIDTSSVIDPSIASGALYASGMAVARYDTTSNRIIAFIDESKAAGSKTRSLWGDVAATLIAGGGGADNIGYWKSTGSGGHDGYVVSHNGNSPYTVAQQQGAHQLVDGAPIIAQPQPRP